MLLDLHVERLAVHCERLRMVAIWVDNYYSSSSSFGFKNNEKYLLFKNCILKLLSLNCQTFKMYNDMKPGKSSRYLQWFGAFP